MNESKEHLPEVVVFAGPNGSGKSTITELLKPNYIDYINADEIKRTLKCTDLEAAQIATRQREEHVENKKEFCFETVMSTDRNLKLLQKARVEGFFIRTYIVITANSGINIERVKGRVEAGGHDVPTEKIVSRYKRSLALIKDVVAVSHVCNIYDNSLTCPTRFFNKKLNRYFYEETPLWPLHAIKDITGISGIKQRNLNLNNPFMNLKFLNRIRH